MADSMEISLLSLDGRDDFRKRTFIITPSTTVPIGRSSKNTIKNLMPAADNAYIDSPVISRDHARLSVSAPFYPFDTPGVYIADNGSMHGTYLNGSRLPRHELQRLHDGDVLRFGDNVVRDTESFIAKTYRYNARRAPQIKAEGPDGSFPRGISVPDGATSDDEELHPEEVTPPSRPNLYGSKGNPVNVDDFEDGPRSLPSYHELEILAEKDDSLLIEVSATNLHNRGQKATPSAASPNAFNEDVTSLPSPAHYTLADGDSSEDEDDIDYPDEESDQPMSTSDDETDSASEGDLDDAGDNVISDVDSECDSLNSPIARADQDTQTTNPSLNAVLNQEHEEVTVAPIATPTNAPPAQAQPTEKLDDTASYEQYRSMPNPISFYQPTGPQLHSESFSNGYWSDNIGGSLSRPLAPKYVGWDDCLDIGAVAARNDATPDHWYRGPDFTRDNMAGYNRTPTFDTIPHPDGQVSGDPTDNMRRTYTDGTVAVDTANAVIGVPTPATPDMNSTIMASPPTAFRTGVSIAEIVDNCPQQPLTPPSEPSPANLKRKADVLDDVEYDELPHSAEAGAAEDAVVPQAHPEVQPRPPKKKSRVIGPMASGVAGFVLGGVAVVSALLWTPEQVFEQFLS
ncbi:hypothetical protein BU24DRAFT_490066 [Aaosphaeria arxii CBS 175.79]|uniref:FHA domain-containing protein n=1 Tax=Aaosphaeria arxii CBS 175.79 TaxID=1450172 RepID=A0A6A5Y6V0_9PLEO|nr:uncharacterized protein BU24DRAFT_490066 [Aaosphaeria arxii CBS 175.79]KAF2020284.1 hypothetical protein BU24DRAFT_490066 [Aaosphaeria arxii CBS 175.79]